MSQVHIIGIGSPFGDDRIGWDAIEAIDRSELLDKFPPDVVRTFCCDQPAVSLLPLMSEANAAILIDAIRSGGTPGTLRKIKARDLQPGPVKISSHGLSVPESIALGRSLGLLPSAVVFYGIEIGSVRAMSSVQPKVHAAIPALLREIAIDLQTLVRKNQIPDTSSPSAGLPAMG